MKIYTSYFYQIRFFKPYQIPFSTALYNPGWFGERIGKNGVIYGLRATPFIPGPLCRNDCHGREHCLLKPGNCLFLEHYRKQIYSLNFNRVMYKLTNIVKQVQADLGFTEEPEIMFIVYEAPDNPCSERGVIQDWFRDNGVDIQEYRHD